MGGELAREGQQMVGNFLVCLRHGLDAANELDEGVGYRLVREDGIRRIGRDAIAQADVVGGQGECFAPSVRLFLLAAILSAMVG